MNEENEMSKDFDLMKAKESLISIDMLRNYLKYDNGVIIWVKSTSNRVKAGDEAGTVHKSGYKVFRFFGFDVKCHRVSWALCKGEWPSKYIDHKNGIRTDNRIENLREASSSENNRNMKKPSHNTSGVKGVGFCKQTGKYTAWIWVNNKKIWLGRHTTKESAREAYLKASNYYHGEFGCDGDR
ncbi:HNH endonuclease [Escherichia phage PH1062]|nr:HNH endonuclease [Escherichia phage PH1062]